jgi:hypothetical protein
MQSRWRYETEKAQFNGARYGRRQHEKTNSPFLIALALEATILVPHAQTATGD